MSERDGQGRSRPDYGGFENYREETEFLEGRVAYRMSKRFPRRRRRAVLVIVVAGVAGYALLKGSGLLTRTPESQVSPRTLMIWSGELKAAGSHGPLGVVPPMLQVKDDGATLLITNTGARRIECVRVSRRQATDVESGSPSCPMWTRDEHTACEPISWGQSLMYSLSPQADVRCAALPVEYRVGDVLHQPPSWWSDSALRDLDRQFMSR